MLYSGNAEPTIRELLDDTIVDLLLARDRVSKEVVMAQLQEMHRRLCGTIDQDKALPWPLRNTSPMYRRPLA